MSETRFPERQPASPTMTPPHQPRASLAPHLSRSSRTGCAGRYVYVYTKANVRRVPVRRRLSKRSAAVIQKGLPPPAVSTIPPVVRKHVSAPRLINLAVRHVTAGIMTPMLNIIIGMMRKIYRRLVMVGLPVKSSVCVRWMTAARYPRRAKTSLAKQMFRLPPKLQNVVRRTVGKLFMQIVTLTVQTHRMVTSAKKDTKTPRLKRLLVILNHFSESYKNFKLPKSGKRLVAAVLAMFLASRHWITEALTKARESLCHFPSSVTLSKAGYRLMSQVLMALAAQGIRHVWPVALWGVARVVLPVLLSSKRLVQSTLAPRLFCVVGSHIRRLAVKLNMEGSLDVACVVLEKMSPIFISMATLVVSKVVTLTLKTLKSPTFHRMLSCAVHGVIVPGALNVSRITVQCSRQIMYRILDSSAIRNMLSQATRKFIYVVIPLAVSSGVAVMMSPTARRGLSLMTQTFIVQPLKMLAPTHLINTMHLAMNSLVPQTMSAASLLTLQSIIFINSQIQSTELQDIIKTIIPHLVTFDPMSVFSLVRHVMTSRPVQIFIHPALQSSTQLANQLHSLGNRTISGITCSLQKMKSLQLWPQTVIILENRLLVLRAYQEHLLTSLQSMTYSEMVGFYSKTVQVLMSPEARSRMSSALRDLLSPSVRGLLASTMRGICASPTETDGVLVPASVQEMVYGLMRMLTSPTLQKLIYPVLRGLLTPAVQAASLPWLQDILHPARHYITFWVDKIPQGTILNRLSIGL